jgi:hypothetical protein
MTSRNGANSGGDDELRRTDRRDAAVDPDAAAVQDQVRADNRALREQARRVEASVPADGEAAIDPDAAAVQEQVKADHEQAMNQGTGEDATEARRNVESARDNADAARESARRIDRDRR